MRQSCSSRAMIPGMGYLRTITLLAIALPMMGVLGFGGDAGGDGGGGGEAGPGCCGELLSLFPDQLETAQEVLALLDGLGDAELRALAQLDGNRVCRHIDCQSLDPDYALALTREAWDYRQHEEALFWSKVAAAAGVIAILPFSLLSFLLGRRARHKPGLASRTGLWRRR